MPNTPPTGVLPGGQSRSIVGVMKTFVLGRREPLPPTLSQNYQELLNPQQYQAVAHPGGPALVIAGAGTGKTRVLTYRVAWLIDHGVLPEQILLLTFTRRAAQEMLQRASTLVGDRASRVQGGTFHAFAHQILRRYAAAIGYPPSFTVMDEGDAEDTLDLLRAEFVENNRRFPRKGTIHTLYSLMVNRAWTLDEALHHHAPQFLEHGQTLEVLRQRWITHKREHALMDFDDLLVHLQTLLTTRPDIRQTLTDLHTQVMVDEFQDTNTLQGSLVSLLAGTRHNVMVVGDEAQSIYGFRGADIRNILDFNQHFPGAILYPLEQNYRSTQPILEVANRVMEEAHQSFRKKLFTTRAGGDLPLLVACPTETSQAAFVAEQVLDAVERQIPLAEQGILIRSSRLSAEVEIELAKRGIPFKKYGGSRFLDAAHIKDVLSHLRVFQNPADIVSWHRMLKLTPGIGARLAANLAEHCSKMGDPGGLDHVAVPSKSRPTMLLLSQLFVQLRELDQPTDMIRRVMDHYQPHLQANWDDYPRRWRDLEYLATLAERFHTLPALLTELTLDPPAASQVEESTQPEDDVLTISTIHSAKGLEWQRVYLLGAADGMFPSRFSLEDPDAVEEERRLMYVAVTRARSELMLCYPQKTIDRMMGMVRCSPSRFVRDIPQEVLEPARLMAEPQTSSGLLSEPGES